MKKRNNRNFNAYMQSMERKKKEEQPKVVDEEKKEMQDLLSELGEGIKQPQTQPRRKNRKRKSQRTKNEEV